MNTNKKTKNVKPNKAIDHMEFTNSFNALKAAENRLDKTDDDKKKSKDLF